MASCQQNRILSTENNPYKIWEKGGPPNVRNQQVAEHQESWNALKTLCFLETVAAPKTDFVSCLCLIPEKMGCLSLYAGIAQSVERRTRNA